MDDESQLLDRARTGDPDAWELLYRRAYPRLIAYARRRLATVEQAEDAVSETMARAMDQIATYSPGAAGVQGWFFGIARNVVLELYRTSGRQLPTDPITIAAVVEPASPAEEPLAAVLGSERRDALVRAFSRLSQADQEVLELRVLGGLDAEQVGRLTGRRAGAVRTAQSRALTRLRVEYGGLMA